MKVKQMFSCGCWIDNGVPPMKWLCPQCREEEDSQ